MWCYRSVVFPRSQVLTVNPNWVSIRIIIKATSYVVWSVTIYLTCSSDFVQLRIWKKVVIKFFSCIDWVTIKSWFYFVYFHVYITFSLFICPPKRVPQTRKCRTFQYFTLEQGKMSFRPQKQKVTFVQLVPTALLAIKVAENWFKRF